MNPVTVANIKLWLGPARVIFVPLDQNSIPNRQFVLRVLQANTKINIILRLPLANIVKLERNLCQQVPAHLVIPANSKIKIL